MPQGDKDKYTDKQKRKAEHIEESYEDRGVPKDEAERRAWATVNKQDGGGKKPGGSGRKTSESSSKKTGRLTPENGHDNGLAATPGSASGYIVNRACAAAGRAPGGRG